MGKLIDENKTGGNESRALIVVLQPVTNIVAWLITYFTLSDEEIVQAGINVGNNKYEEPLRNIYHNDIEEGIRTR
jgi:hypothetical protein